MFNGSAVQTERVLYHSAWFIVRRVFDESVSIIKKLIEIKMRRRKEEERKRRKKERS